MNQPIQDPVVLNCNVNNSELALQNGKALWTTSLA